MLLLTFMALNELRLRHLQLSFAQRSFRVVIIHGLGRLRQLIVFVDGELGSRRFELLRLLLLLFWSFLLWLRDWTKRIKFIESLDWRFGRRIRH
jgi:hypothetical protein